MYLEHLDLKQKELYLLRLVPYLPLQFEVQQHLTFAEHFLRVQAFLLFLPISELPLLRKTCLLVFEKYVLLLIDLKIVVLAHNLLSLQCLLEVCLIIHHKLLVASLLFLYLLEHLRQQQLVVPQIQQKH